MHIHLWCSLLTIPVLGCAPLPPRPLPEPSTVIRFESDKASVEFLWNQVLEVEMQQSGEFFDAIRKARTIPALSTVFTHVPSSCYSFSDHEQVCEWEISRKERRKRSKEFSGLYPPSRYWIETYEEKYRAVCEVPRSGGSRAFQSCQLFSESDGFIGRM